MLTEKKSEIEISCPFFSCDVNNAFDNFGEALLDDPLQYETAKDARGLWYCPSKVPPLWRSSGLLQSAKGGKLFWGAKESNVSGQRLHRNNLIWRKERDKRYTQHPLLQQTTRGRLVRLQCRVLSGRLVPQSWSSIRTKYTAVTFHFAIPSVSCLNICFASRIFL